jgi:hypothetical protein
VYIQTAQVSPLSLSLSLSLSPPLSPSLFPYNGSEFNIHTLSRSLLSARKDTDVSGFSVAIIIAGHSSTGSRACLRQPAVEALLAHFGVSSQEQQAEQARELSMYKAKHYTLLRTLLRVTNLHSSSHQPAHLINLHTPPCIASSVDRFGDAEAETISYDGLARGLIALTPATFRWADAAAAVKHFFCRESVVWCLVVGSTSFPPPPKRQQRRCRKMDAAAGASDRRKCHLYCRFPRPRFRSSLERSLLTWSCPPSGSEATARQHTLGRGKGQPALCVPRLTR